MKIVNRALVLAVAVSCCVINLPFAEDLPLPTLYKNLADKNHYAMVEGLKEASADVKCGLLDQVVAAFPDAAGKPITVKYTWSRPDPKGAATKKMAVSGVPETLPDLVTRATTLAKAPEEFVFPDPPFATILNTDATATSEGGKVTVKGNAKNAADQVKHLQVDVDGATWQVLKMDLDLGQAHIVIETTYKDLGGKWGIETTSILYPQFKKVIKYEYVQAGEFWVPSKISIDQLGPDGKSLEPTYVYEFSNWQAVKAAS